MAGTLRIILALFAVWSPLLLSAQEPTWPLRDGAQTVEDYAQHNGLKPTETFDLGNGVTLEMRLIPSGRFLIGTPKPDPPKETALVGQVIVAVGTFGMLGLLLPLIIPSVRSRRWPQISLMRFLLLTLAAAVCVMGIVRWIGILKEWRQFDAAMARFEHSKPNEKPAHFVTISHPFYLGTYTITQEQYAAVTGTNPSFFKGPKLPVENVSWDDAQEFCQKASGLTGRQFRLPTDAEWEFACRAGTTTAYSTGDTENDLDAAGWFKKNSSRTSHPVGQKLPNGFGLHDMHGNIWQWCLDFDSTEYSDATESDPQNTTSSDSYHRHAIRGGSWFDDGSVCRSASRASAEPTMKLEYFGFRVAMLVPDTSKAASVDPIEAVTIPKVVLDTASADSRAPQGSDAVYLSRIRGLEYHKGDRLKSTESLKVKVLTVKGVAAFSQFEFPFDPSTEQLVLNRLEIADADGHPVSPLPVQDISITDEPHRSGPVRRKIMSLPLPALKPGCTIEVVTTVQMNAPKEIPFREFAFQAQYPVMNDIVFVTGDVDAFRWEASPDVTMENQPQYRCWHASPSRPTEQTVPTLWLSDAALSWQGDAERYLKMLAPVLIPDPAVKVEADKVVTGLSTPAEKITALARYVQRQLANTETEPGVHARIPHSCDDILKNKCGDCKDHAMLLKQMLAAEGIPAFLALVNSTGPVRQSMPTFYQFNHEIVFVPVDGKDLFIDCTDKNVELPGAVPVGLAGKDVFVLDPTSPRFERIPDGRR